jgi:hypothetical protein
MNTTTLRRVTASAAAAAAALTLLVTVDATPASAKRPLPEYSSSPISATSAVDEMVASRKEQMARHLIVHADEVGLAG